MCKKARYYHKNKKKKIQKESRRKYQNLSEEEKEIKQKYRRETYKRLSENKNNAGGV